MGVELEMDHFHPQAADGADEIANLVYACTACNRFKGDYASTADLQLEEPTVGFFACSDNATSSRSS